MVKDDAGKTVVHETVDPTPLRSALSGAVWAGLFGLILGGPVGRIAGLALGAGAGAATPRSWISEFPTGGSPGSEMRSNLAPPRLRCWSRTSIGMRSSLKPHASPVPARAPGVGCVDEEAARHIVRFADRCPGSGRTSSCLLSCASPRTSPTTSNTGYAALSDLGSSSQAATTTVTATRPLRFRSVGATLRSTGGAGTLFGHPGLVDRRRPGRRPHRRIAAATRAPRDALRRDTRRGMVLTSAFAARTSRSRRSRRSGTVGPTSRVGVDRG